jgi:hypothetical protein
MIPGAAADGAAQFPVAEKKGSACEENLMCAGDTPVKSQREKMVCVCLLLQYLIQSCARGGRRIVEDMCYEIRRAEACVD